MPDKKFLGSYFQAVLNKLEADALLFNRKLPHHGLAGAENEQAIADVIRDFLPRKFGVEVNALVIDKHGAVISQTRSVWYHGKMKIRPEGTVETPRQIFAGQLRACLQPI